LSFIPSLFVLAQEVPAPVTTAAPGGAVPVGKGPAAGCGDPSSLFLMLGMLVVFYFLLIRPQQKKAKEHKAMVDALKPGDNVILHSGLFGRVAGIDGNVMKVEIAKGTEVRVLRNYVAGIANPDTEKALQTPQPGA
jgi:preprotein translocase subunit YajC